MAIKFQRVLFLVLLSAGHANAQDVPRFAKYDLGSGMKAYFPAQPSVEHSQSEDKSDVYTCDVPWKEYFFSVIAVKFAEPVAAEDQEILAESYLDYLKGQFKITSSAGYGRGHTMESNPDAKGVIDYWEDENKTQFQVKAWIDSRCMGVMILYGPKEFPIFNAAQMFKEGFRFPD